MLTVIATPQLNKQPLVDIPPKTEHRVQLVTELEQPKLKKKPAVIATKPNPTPVQKGCEAYRAEISKYNWNVSVMMAIMQAESGCRTHAVGDNRVIGGLYAPSCGLMQIRTLEGRPSCETLKHPATNIAWAYKIYLGQGLRAWSVYKNGMYLTYL